LIPIILGTFLHGEIIPNFFKKFKSQRWLLYLGNNTIEAIVYQISTTTQYQHYNQDGDRKRNNYFELPAGMGGLEEKLILFIDHRTDFGNIVD